MALFGLSFGKKSGSQKTSESLAGRQQQGQASRTNTTQSTTATQQTTQDQKTSQKARALDTGTEKLLQDIISSIASGDGALPPEVIASITGNLDFANNLADRALKTEDVINTNTKAIVADARRKGEQKVVQQNTAIARGAGGSNLNTLVAGLQARGVTELETALAGLEGTLGIQARELASKDLATSFAALSEGSRVGADISLAAADQPINQISQLATVLRGAVTETSGVSTTKGTANSQQSVTSLVEALSELLSTSTQDRIGRSRSNSTGFDINFGLD